MREKLKLLLFKNLELNLDNIKFDSDVTSLPYNDQYIYLNYGYTALREENIGCIEDSLNDFVLAINNVKKFTKSFCLSYANGPGYCL
jgi:hypothetical protein